MKIIVLLLFTIPFICSSQEPVTYSDVEYIEGVSKDQLYQRAKNWMINTYNSSNDVLQLDDKNEGQIIGKALMDFDPKVFSSHQQVVGYIKYSIKIFLKDGRYKYEITDFIHDPIGNANGGISIGIITIGETCEEKFRKKYGKKWSSKIWNGAKYQIEDLIPKLIDDLILNMKIPIEVNNDDW